MMAAVATTAICSSFAPTVSAASAMLVCAACTHLVGVTPPALIVGVRRSSFFVWVHLVVSV
jgi:hypothetical protein